MANRQGTLLHRRRAARIRGDGIPARPHALAQRKRPRQDRSRATVEAILDAAAELFADRGYARTTTNHVAARAGVSVGSLYQYFPGKDALLTALVERHMRHVEAVIERSLGLMADEAVPLRRSVRYLLASLQQFHDEQPLLSRAVEEQVGQMPHIPTAYHAQAKRYRESLERMLASRRDVRAGDHRLMARLLFEVTETVSVWLAHGQSSGFDRPAALDEAVEVVCRYIERPTRR